MTDDSGPMVLAGLLALLVVFGLGVGVGRWTGRGPAVGAPPPAVTSPLSVLTVSQTQLRCVNGDPGRSYSREELESRWNVAKMYLQTAESAGLWVDRGRRAARLATAILLEVLVCGDREAR